MKLFSHYYKCFVNSNTYISPRYLRCDHIVCSRGQPSVEKEIQYRNCNLYSPALWYNCERSLLGSWKFQFWRDSCCASISYIPCVIAKSFCSGVTKPLSLYIWLFSQPRLDAKLSASWVPLLIWHAGSVLLVSSSYTMFVKWCWTNTLQSLLVCVSGVFVSTPGPLHC